MSNSEKTNIQWHPAFYAAMEYTLREDRDKLDIKKEFTLGNKPLQMDMLIIEKDAKVTPKVDCAKIFRRYNVIEYKSPEAQLNVDVFYKAIGYAALYKGMAGSVDKYPIEEITVSLFRAEEPADLFEYLQAHGCTIEQRYPGVYYVLGNTIFPVQIVVTGTVAGKKQVALKVLSKHANIEDIREFLELSKNIESPADQTNIDAILQASIAANKDIYEKIRREDPMCEALRELMKDDIEAAKVSAREESKKEENLKIAEKMLRGGEPVAKVVEYTNLTAEAVQELAAKLGVELA